MTNYLHNLKILAAGIALTAAGSAAAETATATWTFTADGVVASTTEGFSAVQANTIGEKLVNKGYDEGKQAVKYNIDFGQVANRIEDSKFVFNITPAVDFTLSEISVDLMNAGWGDGRYDVEIAYNGETTEACKYVTPVRDNASDISVAARTKKYPLETPVEVAAGSECVVTVYYYARNSQSGRNMWMGSLALTGSYGNGGETPDPEPDPDPEVPTYTGEAVPMAAGVFYDLSKGATKENADFQGGAAKNEYVGNSNINTWVEYPFYNEEAGDYMFYFAGGSKNIDAKIGIYLDGADDENLVGVATIVNTDGWTNFQCITLAPLFGLEAGQHTVRVKVLETSGSYAGNWRVAVYDAAPFTTAFNGQHGIYTGGARSENNGENVGNIKNGATATHHLYVSEAGKYDLTMNVKYYGEAVCHITIAEDNIAAQHIITNVTTEEAPERALGSDYKPVTVELGNLTAGTKTLKLNFEADHTGYIANYGNVALKANSGAQTGVENAAIAEETVAVEYYNLQGVRVADNARGMLIRVATAANGIRTATKIVR